MEKTVSPRQENSEVASPVFSMIGNAYTMVKEGKEKDAKREYPMEYHLIKKYLPASVEELTSLLKTKLQIV
jgi:hypothetical protein